MNYEFFQDLITSMVFEQLSKETQALVNSVMSTRAEAINTERVATEENVQEIDMGAKVASPEVAEVLAEVPKSPRTPRLKPTPTKETMKEKKGKQPAIPMHASPRRKPPKPTTQEKGKAINLEAEEEDIEDIPMDDEDVGVETEEIEAQGADPITWLPEYVPPRKPKSKISKDIDESKTPSQTPLLPDVIAFHGPHLARVPILKLEYWDLADHENFPHLVTEQLMCYIIDTNTRMTALEP